MNINFDTTREEMDFIITICEHVEAAGWTQRRMTTVMDLTACHANGCPLDLERMTTARPAELMHDVAGIARHIDRETGKITGCFLPRFAKIERAALAAV